MSGPAPLATELKAAKHGHLHHLCHHHSRGSKSHSAMGLDWPCSNQIINTFSVMKREEGN